MSQVDAQYFDKDNRLRPEYIDDLLVEVVTGKHLFESPIEAGVILASRSPMRADHDAARIVYAKKLAEGRAQSLMSRAEIEEEALKNGAIRREDRADKEALITLLRRQEDARQKTTDPTQKLQLDTSMDEIKQRIIKYEIEEAKIFVHSREARADNARTMFLVYRCTLGGEALDERLWESWEECQQADVRMITAARDAHLRILTGLSQRLIRAVARCNEWRMRWRGARDSNASPFEGSSADWDTNKVNIVCWSKFYDTVFEHPDCPGDKIINDDDALQQWINDQTSNAAKARDRNNPNKPAEAGQRPVTYIDGKGQRKAMKHVGTQRKHVGTPYRIRT